MDVANISWWIEGSAKSSADADAFKFIDLKTYPRIRGINESDIDNIEKVANLIFFFRSKVDPKISIIDSMNIAEPIIE